MFGIRAECPNAQILVVGIGLKGEQWNSGPLRWAPSADNNIDLYNNEWVASCATYGAAYADYRAAALIYEQAHNTPEPGADIGPLTGILGDDFHPSVTGQVLMATTAMAQVGV